MSGKENKEMVDDIVRAIKLRLVRNLKFMFVYVEAYPPLLGPFSHAAALLQHLVALR